MGGWLEILGKGSERWCGWSQRLMMSGAQRSIQRRGALRVGEPERPASGGHKRQGEDAEGRASSPILPTHCSSPTFPFPLCIPIGNRPLTNPPQITVSIGDEIRSSSSLADTMNDSFDGTRVRLRGTMNRMLRMAEKTGVGWRVWLGFFVAVWVVFAYVWLF